jgi:hypothetical protein
MEIVALGEPFDRRAVRFVASWKHPDGALGGLPALDVIFSLGAGVDHEGCNRKNAHDTEKDKQTHHITLSLPYRTPF